MRRGIAAIAAFGLLAACSSSGGSKPRPNPVEIMGKANGCTPDGTTETGQPAFDRSFTVASCTFQATQTTLTVKTFSSNKDRDKDITAGGNADAVITGDRFVVYVFGAAGDQPAPPAAVIAQEVGGQVR